MAIQLSSESSVGWRTLARPKAIKTALGQECPSYVSSAYVKTDSVSNGRVSDAGHLAPGRLSFRD